MGNFGKLLGAIGIGAGLMYYLDPDRGRRRRALVRDKARRMGRVTRDFTGAAVCDIQNRASGMLAEASSLLRGESVEHLTDDRLNARIRSRLGRLVRHPRSVVTLVEGGVVTLQGSATPAEIQALVRDLRHMKGVHDVRNELHEVEANGHQSNGNGRHISPSGQLLLGAGATAVALMGARKMRKSGPEKGALMDGR